MDLMTYQKPLELLLSGKAAWNKWRKAYADVQAFDPDLHKAQLRGVDLHGADLHRADLTEADLAVLVGQQVAEGILRVREGYFKITPGYDGVWGQLDIFEERETAELMQMRLF